MFPTPEESQAQRLRLIETLEAQVKHRRKIKEDLESGKLDPERFAEELDKLQKKENCPIRNNINQKFGSMGTGLDGRGEPSTMEECLGLLSSRSPLPLYTTFPEIVTGEFNGIWIYIDGEKVNEHACKSYAEHFRDLIYNAFGESVVVHIECGPTPISSILEYPIVLEATHHGFLIKKCPNAFTHNEKYLRYTTGNETPDLSTLSLQEIYRLRGHAGKAGLKNVLSDIKVHLNARVGDGRAPYPFLQWSTDLAEVLEMSPPEVWIVVDHEITDTGDAERASHSLASEIYQLCGSAVKVNLHSGPASEQFIRDAHVVLLAMSNGFCVLKARGTSTAGKVIKRFVKNGVVEFVDPKFLLSEAAGSISIFACEFETTTGAEKLEQHERILKLVSDIRLTKPDARIHITPVELSGSGLATSVVPAYVTSEILCSDIAIYVVGKSAIIEKARGHKDSICGLLVGYL